MKTVILKQLSLCNFRGEKERTTVFNPDVTTISGGNGLGKSRHFDAFIWLLFGKDSQDRKDFEVKTRINGEELHKVECSVAGVLEVDGTPLTIKRAFVEDWVKPRGQVEQRFKGNHTECWWNGTPINVTDYDNRIRNIMDATVFKMLTNPLFFVNMPWKIQREQLFQLAGNVSDEEIASKTPEFRLLLDKISGKSLQDFKLEIAALKRNLRGELNEIQPRIDQTYKMKPEGADFDAVEKEIADIDKEVAKLDMAITDATQAIRMNYEKEQAKVRKVSELKSKKQGIVTEAQQKATQETFDNNCERRTCLFEFNSAVKEAKQMEADINRSKDKVQNWRSQVEVLKATQEQLRKDWYQINERQYSGETICPNCGQALPPAMIERAKEIYNQSKLERCQEISKAGQSNNETIAELEARIEEEEKVINSLKVQADEKMALADTLNKKLETLPEKNTPIITESDCPECAEIDKEIGNIKFETSNSVDDNTDEYRVKRDELVQSRQSLGQTLANREVIAACNKEIAELEKKGKELAQQIADAERQEYTIEQFTKKKIEECEKRINGLFNLVSFKLFEYTIDGNPVETCIPCINGVYYNSANTASQINAGLDIINILCRHYDTTAPIFIDNRESVNTLVDTQSQIINLVVNNDNFLTIQ